jgi:hypothetical protein
VKSRSPTLEGTVGVSLSCSVAMNAPGEIGSESRLSGCKSSVAGFGGTDRDNVLGKIGGYLLIDSAVMSANSHPVVYNQHRVSFDERTDGGTDSKAEITSSSEN